MSTILRLEQCHPDLIDHPVVSSLIWTKWRRVNKWIYTSMVLQMIHHLTCTVAVVLKNQTKTTKSTGGQNQEEDATTAGVLGLIWLASWIWLITITVGKVQTRIVFFMELVIQT